MSKKVGLFLCPKGGGYANGIQNATLAKIDEAGEKLQNIGSSVENVGKKFLPVTAAASSNANTNVSMMGETFKYCAPIAGALGFSAEDTAEAIGLMANSGIKASQAGTSLRTIMNNLSGEVTFVGKNIGEVTIATSNVQRIGTLLQCEGQLLWGRLQPPSRAG